MANVDPETADQVPENMPANMPAEIVRKVAEALEDHYGTWRANEEAEWSEVAEVAAKAFATMDWSEQISVREAIRSELIRQHLAGECGGADA